MVARGVRDGDAQCVRKAAALFDLMLPGECVVVPMPSHAGKPRQMLEVASLCTGGGRVLDAGLTCKPHPSSYEEKLAGFAPLPFQAFWNPTTEAAKSGRVPVFVIDNVVCSGMTAACALSAIAPAEAKVCTLAMSVWR